METTLWTVTVEWPPESIPPGAEAVVTRTFDNGFSAWSYYHQWAGAFGPSRVSLLDGETLACRSDDQGNHYGPALLKSVGREKGDGSR